MAAPISLPDPKLQAESGSGFTNPDPDLHQRLRIQVRPNTKDFSTFQPPIILTKGMKSLKKLSQSHEPV